MATMYTGGTMNSGTASPQKPKPAGVDGKAAPMVFPTGGDLQSGQAALGAPQQQPATPKTPQMAPPAPAQAPTFRTLQMAGMARPAPPQMMSHPMGQPAPQAAPAPAPAPAAQPQPSQGYQGNSAVSALLQQMIAQPTAYDDSVIQAQRTAGMGRLEQQGAMDKARLDEEMAGRGLFSSTIAQGRLGDIDINRTNAMADMEAGFLKDRASAMDAGRRSAAELGLSADRNAFDQWQGQEELGLDRQRLGMDDAFRRDELSWDKENSTLDRSQRSSEFDREFGLDTEKLGEDRRQFDATDSRQRDQWGQEFGEDRRQFDADLGYKDRALGEDTRRFDANFGLDKDRFGLDKDQQEWDQNTDFYDLFNNSDLLDPATSAPGQAIPPMPQPRNARDIEGIRAMQEWARLYGGVQ